MESEVNGETRVTAVATRFTAPSNTGDKVRRDALSLFVNPRGSATDDEWTSEEYDWDQICRKDHRFLPENWSDFLVDANGFRYYSPDEVYEAEKARLWAIVEEKYAYMESVDFLDYGPAYSEYSAALNAHSDYYHEGLSSFTTAIPGRCLPYYVAPAFLISGSKYIERPEGSWEQAEAGFIKLKNPENPDFPYVYPKDIENPQNQYDVELMYTEDFYQVYVQGYTRVGEDLDLRIAMRLSNRLNFYVPEGVLTWWQGGFLKTVTDGGRGVTVIPNEITDYGTIHADAKPFGGDSYDRAFNLGVSTSYFKIKDAAPYLLIPRSSRIRETMMLLGTDIQFSSNITKHNKYATIFKAELYRIREDQIDINATSIPDDAEKIEVPDWGNFASPVKDPVTENEYDVTHVTVPGSALDKAGVYAVKISVEFSDGDEVQTLSSIAYIKAKQIPTTIKIDKLESTYADKDNVPSITYSLEYAVQNAEVKYTIQQAGSSDIIEGTGSVSGGTISIPEVSFEGLKTAYTITVYARNSEEDPWSTDSVLITVYNNDILDILIKDVAFGELGGTTGGLEGNGTEVVSGTTVNLDNKAKIEALLDKAGEGAGFAITFDDLLSLRSDIGLMRIVSANYGDGTWGAISDRIKWTYTDSNGKTSSGVTLNNKENGAYADLRSHSHTSYVPSTDFILVATDDRSDDAPVTITATHASSGVTRSFQVTVNTLHDRFYMFRFLPKATTYVSYFNVDDSDLFEKSGCVSWQTFSTNLSAGSHKLTWRFTKDGSYDEKGDFFAIDNLVLTTEGEIKQEDPSLALIPVLNKLEGGIAEGETLNYTISREEGNGMGTYAITVTMGENPNYDVMEVRGGTLTILESLGEPQTIDAGDVTATFGDTGVKISASITTGDGTLSYEVKSGDAVTVDSEGNITIVKAGTAVITVVASQTETYARTTKNVTVTVSPKAMTVSANNVTATVNGQPHGITVTVTDPAQGYTVKYGTTEGTYDLGASPTLAEAGTMTVYYQVTADNYVTFTGSVTLTLVNHIHKMSYTVGTGENANTITATCSNDDCPLPNNTATLTISAPNGDIIYDGAAHAAVITDENGIQGDAKVLYYVKGTDGTYGTASENAPVNAETYKASITLGTGDGAVTVSVEYEIKNAALTNVSVEQSGTLTYSGTAQTPQVTTAATAVNNQTVTFTYSLTEDGEYGAMPTFTDVADSGTVYFKASAPNHDDITGSFTVTMSRANRTAPAAPTLDTATANMIRLTEVDGCEYSMNGTTWQDSATFTGLDKNTQYTFYQRFKETANYNASPSSVDATISTTDHDHEWGNFTVSGATITATCGNSDNGHSGETSATVTITAPTLTVYGGTGSAEATVTNNIDGIDTPTVVYTQGETVLNAAPTGAGTYKASITLGTGEDAVTASVTYTISKKAATVTADNKSKTYGADDPTLTAVVEGTVGNDTINYTLSRAEGNDVGEYEITVNLGDNSNYDVTTTNAKLTIGKKAATVTADNKSKTYGDDDPTLTAVVEGIVGNDTINYTLSRAEGENVDEYVITVTLGENPNYEVSATNAKLTIGKKSASVTADNKSKTYGDDDPELTAVVEGTVGNDTINYTLSRAEGNNVDEYTITVNLGDNPNYDVTTTNGTFTIGKKAATVTADNKSKTYGADDPALTAVVEGTVGNDTISYTLSRAEGNDVGEYAITVNLGDNPNYDVTTTNGTFTIGKKAATVTADNKSKTYGADDPTLTAVVEGIVGNDTIYYTLSRAEGENVDEYVITVTLGENPNYDVTVAGAKLTIVKKAVTLTADDKSKTYSDNDPALTAKATGLVGNDTLDYKLSRAEGENAGTYEITVTLGDNPNYDVTAENGTFIIDKKAASITADNKSKTYGDADPALTATVTGLVGNDTISYTLSRAVGENVGEYTITVTLGNNPNYNVSASGAKLTVTKANSVVAAVTANEIKCDGTAKALVSVSGETGSGNVLYALGNDSAAAPKEGWSADIPTAVNAGTYYVWYMVQGDDNHTDSEAVCVEVTIAPDYSVIPAASPSGTNEPQWTKGSKGGYVITIKESGEDNSFDHFVGVNVDGKELVKDVDYTVEKGSTIVTLKPETAEKLSAGEHTVTVIFDNGEVDTTLTVLAAKSNVGLWIALVAILLIAVVAIIVFVKKKNGTQKVKQA